MRGNKVTIFIVHAFHTESNSEGCLAFSTRYEAEKFISQMTKDAEYTIYEVIVDEFVKES